MWLHGFSRCVSGRSFEFVSTIQKFWSLKSVFSLTELIQCWLVVDGYSISVRAQVANRFSASFNELHVGINVSFASVASEGSFFSIVNVRNILGFISIFNWCHLYQWLHDHTKWYLTCILHALILWCVNYCTSHVLWRTLAFINWNEGNSTALRDFIGFCEVFLRNASTHIVLVNVLDRSGHLIIVNLLLSTACLVLT